MAETTQDEPEKEVEAPKSLKADLSTPQARLQALTLLRTGDASAEGSLAKKAVIDRSLETMLPEKLKRAGVLASLHTRDELIGRMESRMRNLAAASDCLPYILALHIADPAKAPRAIFHLVRRAVHYQPKRGILQEMLGKRLQWEAQTTGSILEQLERLSAPFGFPASSLLAEHARLDFYPPAKAGESNPKKFEDIAQEADEQEKRLYAEQAVGETHEALRKEASGGLTYPQIKDFFPLRSPQAVFKLLVILNEYFQNESNKPDVSGIFAHISKNLQSPDALFETANVFDEPGFKDFADAHREGLFTAAKEFGDQKPWECFLWLKNHAQEIEPQRRGCKAEVLARLHTPHLELLPRACMEERNPLLAAYGFNLLDDARKIEAVRYLLSKETNPRKISHPTQWAFLLARSTNYYLYFARCLLSQASPSATPEKVWMEVEPKAMHVLRMAGAVETHMDSLQGAIRLICQDRDAAVGKQAASTGRRTRRALLKEAHLRNRDGDDEDEEEDLPEGIVKQNAFAELMASRLQRLQLTRSVRAAAAALTGVVENLCDQMGQLVIEPELLSAALGGASAEPIYEAEPASPLRRLGITGVRVRQRTKGGVAIDFTLEGQTDEGAVYPDAIRITPTGGLADRHFLATEQHAAEPIFVAEALRIARSGMDGGKELSGAELETVNKLIGYVPSPPKEAARTLKKSSAPPNPASPPPPPNLPSAASPSAPEVKEVDRTAEWSAENMLTLGEWQNAVAEAESRNVCDLSPDISHIGASYRLLQTTLTMEGYNREIPPGGKHIGYFGGHALSPFVEQIYFQPVEQSHAFWEGLKIDPRNFPGVEQQSDMYVARVRVKIGGNAYEIFGAVFPETHQVLIFGTNPETVQEGDRLSLALSQLILIGFKVAVQREDDPTHTETDRSDAGVQRGRWATEADRVIMDVSRTSYPAIVMVPGPIKDEHTLVVGQGRGEGESRRQINEGTFNKVLDLEDKLNPEDRLNTLTKKYGCFLCIPDYVRAFPDKKKRFPAKIFKGSSTQLKSEYSEAIYVPLSVEEIEQVLAMIRLHKNNMEVAHLYIRTPATAARNKRLPYLPRTNGSEAPDECVFHEGEFDVPADTDLNVVEIIAGNRLRFSHQYPFWLLGENRRAAMDLAASLQDPAGRINLKPRARALLVYEFEDEGVHSFGYRYLSTGKDAKYLLGSTTDVEKVSQAITSAKKENRTKVFSDFANHLEWETRDLERFEEAKIIELQRNARGQILEILPKKKILRKKIVILDEDIGYQQVEIPPPTLVQLMMHATTQGKDFWRDVYEPAQAAQVAQAAAS